MGIDPRAWVCGVVGMLALGGARAEEPWERRTSQITASVGWVGVSEIGRSHQGRPIQMIELRADRTKPRATVLIVAGIDGRHGTGTEVALGVAERLISRRDAVLKHGDVVIVPCLNPDGMARFQGVRPVQDNGNNASPRATAREDADRDRRVDEDGPMDLDGDGVITRMRILEPRPGLLPGLAATEVAEPDDARLLRRADAGKSERPRYAVLMEGRDQDGDGAIGEDGVQGVDLDQNFPYHWPEFGGESGPYALSEPESRAMAMWLLAHPEVVAIMVYGPNDNMVNVSVGGKMDATGEVPIPGGVLDDDRGLFERVSNQFKEVTKMKSTGGVGRGWDGSLQGWAYAQLGIASFMTPAWVRPDCLDKPKEEAKPEDKAGSEQRKAVDTDDGRWIQLSDEGVEAKRVPGFVEWKAFDHPQLGRVEIGGFVPGFRMNPADPTEVTRVVEEQTGFVAKLVDAVPRVVMDDPAVAAVGPQVWKIRARVVNQGQMPTRLAMGVRTRRLPPTRLEIDVPKERLLAGVRVQGAESIAGSGGALNAAWTIVGDAGTEVRVKLLAPECGDAELVVKLERGEGEAK